MSQTKENLALLRSQQWFREFMAKQVMPGCPAVREHNPEDSNNSVEQWKAESASRRGYLSCLQQFGFSLEDLKELSS